MSELPESTLEALTNGPKGFDFDEEGNFRGASGAPAVGLFRIITIQNALQFEIKTGMKMSRMSALKAANQVLGTNYKRKQKALDHITAVLDAAKGLGVE
jgi:hypothetical protein